MCVCLYFLTQLSADHTSLKTVHWGLNFFYFPHGFLKQLSALSVASIVLFCWKWILSLIFHNGRMTLGFSQSPFPHPWNWAMLFTVWVRKTFHIHRAHRQISKNIVGCMGWGGENQRIMAGGKRKWRIPEAMR